MRIPANNKETIVIIPLVLEPIQVQIPLVSVVPEIWDIPLTIPVLPNRVEGNNRILALLFGILLTEGEEFGEIGWAITSILEFGDDGFGAHLLVEMDEFEVYLLFAFLFVSREVFLGDVGIDPVVLAGGDQLFEGEGVVDGGGEDGTGDRTGLLTATAHPEFHQTISEFRIVDGQLPSLESQTRLFQPTLTLGESANHMARCHRFRVRNRISHRIPTFLKVQAAIPRGQAPEGILRLRQL